MWKMMLKQMIEVIQALPEEEKIDALNQVKCALHIISPFANEPVDCVIWVDGGQVFANNYNPNKVAPPEMKLLEHSIREDGYTQPIVAFSREEGDYEVIDGFHRNRVGKEVEDIHARIRGYLPLSVINIDRTESKDRIASTIRHNRARGVHGIEPMAEIVSKLYFNGWSNKRIAKELGMDKEEILRLKQFTGLGSLFENRNFSSAWDLEKLVNKEDA